MDKNRTAARVDRRNRDICWGAIDGKAVGHFWYRIHRDVFPFIQQPSDHRANVNLEEQPIVDLENMTWERP